jgi:TPR repeat protein
MLDTKTAEAQAKPSPAQLRVNQRYQKETLNIQVNHRPVSQEIENVVSPNGKAGTLVLTRTAQGVLKKPESVEIPETPERSDPIHNAVENPSVDDVMVPQVSVSQEQADVSTEMSENSNTDATVSNTDRSDTSNFFPNVNQVSFAQTLELYRQNSKKAGDPFVQFNFAKYLIEASKIMTEDGRQAHPELLGEGIKMIKKLASQPVSVGKFPLADAQFFLAECYGQGTCGLAVDHAKSFEYYLQASKQNFMNAAYRVAVCYELGAGTKKDYARAVSFYRKASSLNDPHAMHKLGLVLFYGLLNQPKNQREGLSWLKRAANMSDASNPQALHDLGFIYESNPIICSTSRSADGTFDSATNKFGYAKLSTRSNHNVVISDDHHAFELYTKACEFGYAPSLYRVGCAYEYGQMGCAINPMRSIEHYRAAAKHGYAEAELALSGWYLTGAEGVIEQNDAEAFRWAQFAAEKNLARAEFALGHYYEKGIGVKADIEQAKYWYNRASLGGSERAKLRMKNMRKTNKAARKVSEVINCTIS